MRQAKTNPYESPATARSTATDLSPLGVKGSAWIGGGSLIVAIICIIAVHCIVQLLLSVGWWDRRGAQAQEWYTTVHYLGMAMFLIGLAACCVTVALGRWTHRLAIVVVALPYLPFVVPVFSWITKRMFGAF